MLFVDLLGWWYSRGWGWAGKNLFLERTHRIAEFFSIKDLLLTLFAPFRQDTVNVKGAPIGVRFQVLGENIISRFFGAIIRSGLIVVGLILLVLHLLTSVAFMLLWPLLPGAPLLAIIFWVTGLGV